MQQASVKATIQCLAHINGEQSVVCLVRPTKQTQEHKMDPC